jgi:hypothetical protein
MSIEKLIALCIVALAYGLVGVVFWVVIMSGLKHKDEGGK